jgi:hypothetical protein
MPTPRAWSSQYDCENNRCHTPPEWSTDDVGSDVADEKMVIDGAALTTTDSVTPVTLSACDGPRLVPSRCHQWPSQD